MKNIKNMPSNIGATIFFVTDLFRFKIEANSSRERVTRVFLNPIA
jgi:hypothetical protein